MIKESSAGYSVGLDPLYSDFSLDAVGKSVWFVETNQTEKSDIIKHFHELKTAAINAITAKEFCPGPQGNARLNRCITEALQSRGRAFPVLTTGGIVYIERNDIRRDASGNCTI
jgi:hypothetical protein